MSDSFEKTPIAFVALSCAVSPFKSSVDGVTAVGGAAAGAGAGWGARATRAGTAKGTGFGGVLFAVGTAAPVGVGFAGVAGFATDGGVAGCASPTAGGDTGGSDPTLAQPTVKSIRSAIVHATLD